MVAATAESRRTTFLGWRGRLEWAQPMRLLLSCSLLMLATELRGDSAVYASTIDVRPLERNSHRLVLHLASGDEPALKLLRTLVDQSPLIIQPGLVNSTSCSLMMLMTTYEKKVNEFSLLVRPCQETPVQDGIAHPANVRTLLASAAAMQNAYGIKPPSKPREKDDSTSWFCFVVGSVLMCGTLWTLALLLALLRQCSSARMVVNRDDSSTPLCGCGAVMEDSLMNTDFGNVTNVSGQVEGKPPRRVRGSLWAGATSARIRSNDRVAATTDVEYCSEITEDGILDEVPYFEPRLSSSVRG